MSSSFQDSQDVVDKRFFGLVLPILRRWWWIVGLASALIGSWVYFYVSTSDVRYESVAIVRGWRDPLTQKFITDRELEVLVNSADLLREAHRASASTADREDVSHLDRGIIIRVQWLPNSQLLSFTASGIDPEATQGLLAAALPLLFRALKPDQQTLAKLHAERQVLLAALRTLQDAIATVVARDKHSRREEVDPTLAAAVQFSFLSGTVSDLETAVRQLDTLDIETFSPSERSIIQPPTRANAPLPNRAAATSVLAAIGSALTGLAVIILVAFARMFNTRRDAEDVA